MKINNTIDPQQEFIHAGYRYALSLTRHHENAEDLVQQAWLKLSRKYGEVSHRALLFTTIRNQFYDECRRNKVVQLEAIEHHPEPINHGNAHEDSRARNDLDFLLTKLNHREREILQLNAVEGYTASEIADQTETPRGTVLSMLSRSKNKLRYHAMTEMRS